jgi:riboflavin kinase/FMN adenylyltransferase
MKHLKETSIEMKQTCVAFGRFESMHKGHRAVINHLVKQEKKGYSSVLLNLTNEAASEEVVYTIEEKCHMLEKDGPMYFWEYPFNDSVMKMSPEAFVKEVLVGQLGAKVVVVGENHRFGHQQEGNLATLKDLGLKYHFEVVVCETETYEEQPITCEAIKEAIGSGQIEKANDMLGHPYTFYGEVVHGKALGRTVGMPTANLGFPKNKLIPKHGVYATMTEIQEDEMVQGLTNIGKRPSVDDHSYVTIETFLLDFSRDIYGKRIRLEIHNYIRGVKKFNGLDEVKAQVEKDIEAIKDCLNVNASA